MPKIGTEFPSTRWYSHRDTVHTCDIFAAEVASG
jgi:hypothetical protein